VKLEEAMRFAVIESGGKQYLARQGQVIDTDHLPYQVGHPVEFRDVLLVVDGSQIRIGAPVVDGVVVRGKVVAQGKSPKVVAFRYFPKKRIRKKIGHRQLYTRVTIDAIVVPWSESEVVAESAAGSAADPARKRPARTAAKPAAKSKPAAAKTREKPAAPRGPTTKTGKGKK
jgi:large subunit ribosomal protein L21